MLYFMVSETLAAGALLRRARKGAGLSQQELAVRAGVTQSVISAYESGYRQPAVPTLAALVDAAGYELVMDLRQQAGKRLAVVALRPQALEDQLNRCRALLNCRFTSVQHEDGPRAAGPQRNHVHNGTLVRRGLVVKRQPLIPALARRPWRNQLQRPLRIGFVCRP